MTRKIPAAERRTCLALAPRSSGGVGSRGAERGSVTAELAVLLPALTLLLALIVTAAQLGLTQLRVSEAAYAGARAVARGDEEAVAATVRRTAGPAARAAVRRDGDDLLVTVTLTMDTGLAALLSGTISATASARAEQVRGSSQSGEAQSGEAQSREAQYIRSEARRR